MGPNWRAKRPSTLTVGTFVPLLSIASPTRDRALLEGTDVGAQSTRRGRPTANCLRRCRSRLELPSLPPRARVAVHHSSRAYSWNEVEAAWKKWIGESAERLGMLVGSIAIRSGGLYGYTPRYWHRSSWDQLVRDELHRRARGGANLRLKESALVRIAYRSGMFADGAQIFSAGFLRAQPGAGEIDFGRDPFYESFKREEERGAPAEHDDDWPDDLYAGDDTDV